MPRILTQAIGLLVALIYACFISIVLLPVFLIFRKIPNNPGELLRLFRNGEFLERANVEQRRRIAQRLPEELPGARDIPSDELPQARRARIVSRHEIMMGRESQIAQYRGFLLELHEWTANRAANNGRVVAPPAVVDDSSSEAEFDIDDHNMSLP
ncbi:uncharacterized protein EAF01_011100 [Botrytis porri]|uniref:uncharacterized protein n=1 Tax=Botrytis porri TaxID=87229 RepID=UPI0019005828|nr:uncharacterized protein EAF01_011100 [Botrytis porri]KAF7887946.1 hypothetical protein EAF01_011100 [Botrytis porri]